MTIPSNQALAPVAVSERVFGLRDHASLWFSLGVGLLVIQVGAYLMPALSMRDALLTIVLGSVLGAGLLAWVAKIAAETGLGSAALMRHVFGATFARLPIALNLLQLLGWGAFELVIMRDATLAIARQSGGMAASWWSILVTIAWGAVIALLLSGSMVRLVRRLVSRIALPLVVLSLLWLSWHFARQASVQGWAGLWNRPGEGGMSWLAAMDLVVAMPVSWLPLVADYARHGRDGGSALRGVWLGYALANIWCYGLGVLVMLTLPGDDLVTALLLAQGGLAALTLILIDEVDNVYGDVYSGAMSAASMAPRLSIRQWGVVLAVLCVALALAAPMRGIEPFLLLLSSVFVPLYGVILGRLAGVGAAVRASQAADWGRRARPVHAAPVIIWLAGVAVYQLFNKFWPDAGATLPTLVLCFVAARFAPFTTVER